MWFYYSSKLLYIYLMMRLRIGNRFKIENKYRNYKVTFVNIILDQPELMLMKDVVRREEVLIKCWSNVIVVPMICACFIFSLSFRIKMSMDTEVVFLEYCYHFFSEKIIRVPSKKVPDITFLQMNIFELLCVEFQCLDFFRAHVK